MTNPVFPPSSEDSLMCQTCKTQSGGMLLGHEQLQRCVSCSDSQSCETSVQKPRKGFAVIMIEFDDPDVVNTERWNAASMRIHLSALVEGLIETVGQNKSYSFNADHFRSILTNYGWHDNRIPHEVLFARHWELDQEDKEESSPSADRTPERVENTHPLKDEE